LRLPIIVIAALSAVIAGCGGSDSSKSATSGPDVFASAGCANCHTLKAASAGGRVGPDLDELKPSAATVEAQVTNGGGGMPAFKGNLSPAQITSVADYVAANAGK
jgi:mono/diheme cytochrome c family protein